MDKFDLLKSHIEAFTRKDGSVVSAHDDKRQSKEKKVTHATLKKHSMYTPSDHEYFKSKGYEPHEIKHIWDRDLAAGNDPVHHKEIPNYSGVMSDPDFYKKNPHLAA